MGKIAQRYLDVDPWKIIETGFHEKQAVVSESLFSLSNEYMGVRGFFDEGYPKESLIGTYFNGIYEIPKNIQRSHYKGISDKSHYMVNAANAFYTRIFVGDEMFVFNPNNISDYKRELDLKTGEQTRSYQVKDLFKITFKRILNMTTYQVSHQNIKIEPIHYQGQMSIQIGIDFRTKHWGKPGFWDVKAYGNGYALGYTTTNQSLFSRYNLDVNTSYQSQINFKGRLNIETINFNLNKPVIIQKTIVSLIDKKGEKSIDTYLEESSKLLNHASYEKTYQDNQLFYQNYFSENDILIEGDPENQQGIRYCLFQLVNTYLGVSEENNIGAKGLTGEAYSGHAFWDSETYCVPVYLFTNPKAAKNLLMFRYNTLKQAKKRAQELDCKGACYPIATLNGDEACDLWQHASLQFQPSSAVAYAIWHYVKNTKDIDFMLNYGFEMLVEIARFFSSRGQYNQDQTKFGYYGVMGPDEFQMMVNHNAYTNLLAKESMFWMIDVYETYQNQPQIQKVVQNLGLTTSEIEVMKKQCELMYIPYDEKTKIYEQHEGFHDLPHIDIHSIPVTDFPLYAHWSYDRIYRNDMIKQPDVLMFMFLFNQRFDIETKKANYDYYEPKTIHESSLSPSIHSIFASELGYKKQALEFFRFATRMDLDDYNRNTKEGLHLTSIAAAWVNIVYGFGGLRSDGNILKLAPYCPDTWKSYQFNFHYFDSNIRVYVNPKEITLTLDQDLKEPLMIYDKAYHLKKGMTTIHVGN
ncbi:glycoside hydrolase family 65 protein [Peloplasma aerotolerans]|uniref:Glycosyl hydrolase family 65 protein n=1 Tax=Peloplasma aerotolerans TaxID=3044389 RepID=A0AAW6U7T0_9MOLU|nr:glycosyl hydrolase family 65 protein [Mariniplasma sp. M4Ah]MDI6452547.1 glycosyl hydrolase family 65 protein [Mariniplasma sp. M4Ah]